MLCDLGTERWPFEDSSVDHLLAEHILEHLPGETFFHFLREAWRVGKNGAVLKVLLPHPRHDIFLNDPTHVRPVLPATFFGFSKKHMDALAARGLILTPFYKYHGIDFDLSSVTYWFDEKVDKNDPTIEWRMKHEYNVIAQWGTTLTVVK